MALLKRIKTTVGEAREIERLKAETAQNKANNDYIAMMADIELSGSEPDALPLGYTPIIPLYGLLIHQELLLEG